MQITCFSVLNITQPAFTPSLARSPVAFCTDVNLTGSFIKRPKDNPLQLQDFCHADPDICL